MHGLSRLPWALLALIGISTGLSTFACSTNSMGDGLPHELTCTSCHGNESNAAPPMGLNDELETSELAVGAHQAHLSDGLNRAALECKECHVVPEAVEDEGHVDQLPAELTFGTLAVTGGLNPVWHRPSGTCANTYCHGASLSGGLHRVPQWTLVDESQKSCESCHGNPPPAPHPQMSDCQMCHPDTVAQDGTIILSEGKHLDGVIDSEISSCDVCHGGDGESAPPMDTQGNRETSARGVGAHRVHLGQSDWHAQVSCEQCHLVPNELGDPGHKDDELPAELTWGALASADGALPAFDGQSCSNVYCHGATLEPGGSNTQPVWTTVNGSQAACGTCHGMPPGGNHPPGANACENCHSEVIGPNQTWVAPQRHMDGVVDLSNYHPEGYDDGDVHGPHFNGDPATCQSCHGDDLLGGSTGTSCEQCHPAWKNNCGFCHGDVATGTPAPPEDVAGNSSESDRGVGAHQAHLTADSTWRADITCENCHLVPNALLAPGHLGPSPAELDWSQGIAANDSASPAFDGQNCSGVYCHGETLQPGGSNTQPDWTAGSSQAFCTTCHGLPPGGSHPSDNACANCHGEVIAADGSWQDPSRHINGILDISDYHPGNYADPNIHGPDHHADASNCQSCHGSDYQGGLVDVSCETCHPGWSVNCGFCHGDKMAQTPLPPQDVAGNSLTTDRGVGAHVAHMVQGSGWRADIACDACHVVPQAINDAGHVDPSPAELVWISGIGGADGASPSFNGTSCSGVYCHGETLDPGGSNTTPLWTVVDGSQDSCGTCHDQPPQAPHPDTGATNCNTCHGESINPDGSFAANGSRHVDGIVDLAGACDVCHANPPTSTGEESYPGSAGAHASHVGLGLSCTTCHGHNGTGPQHNQGSGSVVRANVDVVFDASITYPGGTTMDNGAAASHAQNGANPTCNVGCHNPVVGDDASLANLATWTDSSISCLDCHERPGASMPLNHAIDTSSDAAVRADCQVCHDYAAGHGAGTMAMQDPDGADGWSYSAGNYSGLCRTCHDGGGGSWFGGSPQDESLYWTLPSAHESAGTDCSDCHAHHGTATGALLIDRQEGLCYTCHDGAPAGSDIQAQFALSAHHPVLDSEQSDQAVECISCHNPHQAQPGLHIQESSAAGQVLHGSTGVLPDTWNSASVGPTYPAAEDDWSPLTMVGGASLEAAQCFRCHSSYRSGLSGTDIAREFNPNNANYHAVVGDSKADSGHGSYLSPWDENSRMTCTDCHQAHGSDGATQLIAPYGPNTGKAGTEGHLCFNCHDFSVYGYNASESNGQATGFAKENYDANLHATHLSETEVNGCPDCHGPVVHGWSRSYPLWTRNPGDEYLGRISSGGGGSWGPSGSWTKQGCGANLAGCHD